MPVLKQLHWLPVQQCIEFQLAILAYKVLNGLSSQYLADSSLSLFLAGDDFDCPMSLQVRLQELATNHSLLLHHISGTIFSPSM